MGIVGGRGRGSFQLFTQSNGSEGVYADAAARDVYFAANPTELARLDANEFLIIKLLDDGAGAVAYQQRSGGNWLDVTSIIQGNTGPAGATGNSYFFSSISARDTFFGTSPNEGLLENGLPVVVNIGDDTQSTFVWGGGTAPPSYDSTLWRLAAAEISSGTLFLGTGGSNISSGAQVLNFTAADETNAYVSCIEYDDTGSENPTYWKLGALAQFPLADVFNTVLTDPQILSTTNTLNAYVKDYTLIPATSGELRVQTWLGTDETGSSIVDTFITVAPGDVGNETVFTAPNNTLILTGQDTYTKLSGITLYGGLQTLPTFVGQVVPFVTLGLWAAESYEFITADNIGSDTEILYNNAGAIDGATGITYDGSSLNLTDNMPLRFGVGDDFTIIHNETDTLFVSNTGDMEFYNTDATGLIYFTLGTDTAATSFQVRDNSSVPLFEVFGDGAVSIGIDPTISINTEGNVDFKNSISTPYLGSGQLQNLLRWSEDTTNVVWTETPQVLVITGDTVTAPDGTQTADTWDFSVFVGTGVLQAVVLTNGATYTLSFWARALTTARDIRFDLGNGAFKDVTVEVTDDLQRYSVELVAGNNDILYVINHIATAGTIYVWGFQINEGVERLPYAKTEATLINAGGSEAGLVVNGNAIIDGYVGIGTSTPHAPLQFENVSVNRKIVLWEDSNNDHQFIGFGVNSFVLRYQVDKILTDHVFYAATSPTTSDELMRITGDGKVGIGTSNPHAPLEFAQGDAFRKIVLSGVDNNNEFYGFGVNSGRLLYQVNNITADHVFFAATSFGSSHELMRITGDQKVGIGGIDPISPLHVYEDTASTDGTTGLTVEQDGAGDAAIHLVRTASQRWNIGIDGNDLNKFKITPGTDIGASPKLTLLHNLAYVGIGNSDPHAPLQFANELSSRKIVLWEVADNDHQFFGIGLDNTVFRYQVASTVSDHVFYAGTSSTTSDELMRIAGDGNVTIGTVGSGGRFAFFKSTDDSSLNIYSGSATGSASTVFHNSASAIAADIIYNETLNNFNISTEAGVDLILATGSGANIGVNKPIPVSTLHISEGTTTSDSTTGTTFEQIGLGSAVTHYVRTNTGTVFSSGIDEDDVYKISNDYDLAVNTDIAINTEGNTDFKNTIATPYGGFGRLQNLLRWSEDTANTTVWNAQAPQVVVTGDQATAPDGTLTADEWAYTGSIGLALRNFAISLNIGVTYTVSFWARALVSERVIRVDLGDGGAADITVLVTDDLQRYSATMVAGAQDWLDITNPSAFASTIYVWGFQVNEGTERLPYTRTEAVQVHGTGPESGLAINHSAIFSTIAAPNYSEGTVFYDDGDKALSYYNEDSNVTVGIGRDLLVRVQNDQGTTISSGEAVYINGSSAGLPTVKLARSDSSVTSQFAGIVTETLVLNGEIGYVSTFGLIEFLNTSAWSAGDELYLSSTVAGALTNVPPTDPNHIVSVAHVVTSDLITGSIQVHTPERIAPDALYSSIYSPITAPAPHTEGQVYYDTDDKSLSYQTSSTDVTINIGKEIVVPPQIYNGQGSAITNGQAVYVSGSTGVYPEVKLAQANSDATAHSVGLITETSIANGETGYCTTYGLVRGFNTTSWSAGDVLYLSPTVAGGLQNTKPVFPNLAIRMGIVISSAADGTIWVTYPTEEATTGSASTTRSFAFSDSGAADSSYLAGYYEAPTSSTQLTIGGASSITYGTDNVAYGAHAFCVASAAGGTDLVLTVSGTSITDAGVRTTSDSEILVADTDTAITDQYFETTKKWVGQIVYELTGAAGSFIFNYGFCKYEDFGNRDFTVVDFEFVGKSGVNAANMNIELLLHSGAGWTYNNTSFVPGGTTIVSLGTDYSIDDEMAADEYFAYKRGSLSQSVLGTGAEGVIIRYTQSTNNSVDYGTAHIGVLI